MAKVRRCPQCGRIILASASECRYCAGIPVEIPRRKDGASESGGDNGMSMPKFSVPSFSAIKSAGSAALGKIKDAVPERQSASAAAPAAPASPKPAVTPAETVDAVPPTVIAPPQVNPQPDASQDKSYGNVQQPQQPQLSQYPVYGQPVQEQFRQPYSESTAEYYEQPRKSRTGLIVGIIIAVVVLLAGIGVGAYLLLDKNSGDSYEKVADDPYESRSESESKDAADTEMVNEPVAEVDPVDHYRIQTVISGYPIKLELDIDEYGNVNGRYAYMSTLNKYGDKPSSWFTLSGTKRGRDVTLEATHNDYGHFENWFVELSGSPERPSISGSINNFNTREMFYLNSNQKKEYYGGDTGEDYYEEAYEPETL